MVLTGLFAVTSEIESVVKDVISHFTWWDQFSPNAALAADTTSNSIASAAKIILLNLLWSSRTSYHFYGILLIQRHIFGKHFIGG